VGSYNGVLKTLTAVQLGTAVVKKLTIDRQDIIDQLIFGNVLQANVGQAPARQVALGSGLKPSTVCTTVNKVCSSGLKAVIMGVQSITLGDAKCIVAGGMESMSNAPFYLESKVRRGLYGKSSIQDAILRDGLIDPYDDIHMEMCGEETARDYSISRKDQDEYTIQSYKRASEAWKSNLYKAEIVDIQTIKETIYEDEEFKKIDYEKIPKLKPVFMENGTLTAANSSTINDGASAVLLSSDKEGAMAKILGYGEAECPPKLFTIAPTYAIPIALERAFPDKPWKESMDKVSLFEVNEAFAVVALVNMRLLNIPNEKYNVRGGAVSLGHPIGSSGCRILVTLCHALLPGQIGLAAVCNGGGGASAMVIERL
jgi:acetyl-CoA C-acetyltransferase